MLLFRIKYLLRNDMQRSDSYTACPSEVLSPSDPLRYGRHPLRIIYLRSLEEKSKLKNICQNFWIRWILNIFNLVFVCLWRSDN